MIKSDDYRGGVALVLVFALDNRRLIRASRKRALIGHFMKYSARRNGENIVDKVPPIVRAARVQFRFSRELVMPLHRAHLPGLINRPNLIRVQLVSDTPAKENARLC